MRWTPPLPLQSRPRRTPCRASAQLITWQYKRTITPVTHYSTLTITLTFDLGLWPQLSIPSGELRSRTHIHTTRWDSATCEPLDAEIIVAGGLPLENSGSQDNTIQVSFGMWVTRTPGVVMCWFLVVVALCDDNVTHEQTDGRMNEWKNGHCRLLTLAVGNKFQDNWV